MKIYSVNSAIFTAKKVNNSTMSSRSKSEYSKRDFYNDIDGFLNNKFNKESYVEKFSDGVDNIVRNRTTDKYNSAERAYINNLMSVIEMSEGIERIPDKYLRDCMQDLLKAKK